MKQAKDMSPEERKAALDEAARERESIELDMSKTAAEMSESERREWLAKHRRKFG